MEPIITLLSVETKLNDAKGHTAKRCLLQLPEKAVVITFNAIYRKTSDSYLQTLPHLFYLHTISQVTSCALENKFKTLAGNRTAGIL